MATATRYVFGNNLNEYFVDKDTGLPLSGGKVYFFRDTARNVGKLVYQQTGSPPNYTYTALPNPITLSSVGTIDNGLGSNVAIYYFPYDDDGNLDLYYIVVTDSVGNVQLVREAWPDIEATDNPFGQPSGEVGNQISNSQFVDVDFNDLYGSTISFSTPLTAETFDIAPGWQLIVSSSGSGSIDVGRLSLQGSLNINTNPPYALTVLPSGANISSIKLRQRLYDNPDIWATGFLSGFMVIASLDGLSHTIEMTYAPSIAPAPQTIVLASTGISGYVSAANVITVDPGINTSAPPAGYVDIDIILPKTGYIAISSVQIIPTPDNAIALYGQETVNRQEDHLFHYYNPHLQAIPAHSLLECWDFKVNPAQWGSSISMGAVRSDYLWDQTIGWQSIDNYLSVSRAVPRALKAEVTSSTGQFALVQYMSGTQLREFLSNSFSVLMKARVDTGGSAVSGTVSFWVTSDVTLPDINVGTNLSLVLSLDANGKPATSCLYPGQRS